MRGARPLGRYGIDAPWVPWLWAALTALYVVLTVLSATSWDNPVWVTALLGLVAVVLAAGCATYCHATLRGKFDVWAEILGDAGTPRRALDLGCGHGAVSIMVATRFPDVEVEGVDLWRRVDQSHNSPEAAAANADANGVGERIRFVTGDMTSLPYADAAFDLVTASLSVHNIPTAAGRAEAIEEAWRVLDHGGRLLVLDISKTREYEQVLARLGAHVVARSAGWRVWWSGPWMASRILTAAKS